MHIERIEHSKSVETVNSFGLKEWTKTGVSVVLAQEESPELALEMAKDFVNKDHPTGIYTTRSLPPEATILPEIQVEKVKDQTLEEQILSCMEKKVLESYKFIAKKDPILSAAYDTRMEQLKLS